MSSLNLKLNKVGIVAKEEVDVVDGKSVFLVKEDISDEQRSRLAEYNVRVVNWGSHYLVDSVDDDG